MEFLPDRKIYHLAKQALSAQYLKSQEELGFPFRVESMSNGKRNGQKFIEQ